MRRQPSGLLRSSFEPSTAYHWFLIIAASLDAKGAIIGAR